MSHRRGIYHQFNLTAPQKVQNEPQVPPTCLQFFTQDLPLLTSYTALNPHNSGCWSEEYTDTSAPKFL